MVRSWQMLGSNPSGGTGYRDQRSSVPPDTYLKTSLLKSHSDQRPFRLTHSKIILYILHEVEDASLNNSGRNLLL
jgi:hypothetical protein